MRPCNPRRHRRRPPRSEQAADEMTSLCNVAASNGTRMRRRGVLRSLPVLVVGAVSAAVLAVTAATAVATSSQVSAASPLTGKIWVLCLARREGAPRGDGAHVRVHREAPRVRVGGLQPLRRHLQGVRELDPDLAARHDTEGLCRADRASGDRIPDSSLWGAQLRRQRSDPDAEVRRRARDWRRSRPRPRHWPGPRGTCSHTTTGNRPS